MTSGRLFSQAVALFGIALAVCSCAANPPTQAQPPDRPEIMSSTTPPPGLTDQIIGQRYPPMSLTKRAEAAEYGYSEKVPIAVGGGFPDGADKVYSYLNSLKGPQGQKIHYSRIGTCCSFKAPDSPFDGTGLLEVYEITYDGLSKPTRLYFNWYGAPDPQIPVGLTAAQ